MSELQRIQKLLSIIGDARILLADYDGYYDPATKTGDAEKLSELIVEVDNTLNDPCLGAVCKELVDSCEFVGGNDHGDAVPDYNRIMDEHVSRVYKLELELSKLTGLTIRLRVERDNIRRIYCEYVSLVDKKQTPQEVADMQRWDCFVNVNLLDELSRLDQELGL